MTNERIYPTSPQERRQDAALVVAVLGLGMLIGALLALLFAPQSGDKTRQNINQAFDHGVQVGRKNAETTVERLEHEVYELRKSIQDRLKQSEKS